MSKTHKKLYIGLAIAGVGLLSMFFDPTKNIGAFLIGFGLVFGVYNANGETE